MEELRIDGELGWEWGWVVSKRQGGKGKAWNRHGKAGKAGNIV